MKPLYKPRDGVCSRGWLFMGEQGGPCDQKCEMCYYSNQKNLVFFSYETLLQHANVFRHHYGLDACDITGGEPTIYKTPTGDIVDLVQHCSNIGLKPTIISHGQNNRDDFKLKRDVPVYKAVEAAGLNDWLLSLHGGSPDSHDAVLSSEGSFDRLVGGLERLERPVRFNTTLLDKNLNDLPVNVLKDRPPTVWNLINFNPFHVWAGEKAEEIDFQVSYTESAEQVAKAVDELEGLGWEVNVRYWPLCIAEKHGFAANVCGYHQVSDDPWEWRLNATMRTPMKIIEQQGGWVKSERKLATEMMESRTNPVCAKCAYSRICDAPPEQYQKKYGLDELQPADTDRLNDPLHFQKERRVRNGDAVEVA